MRLSALLTCGLLMSLAGCTVALNREKWDSWIGSNWRDYNASNGSGNCSAAGTIVTCPQALGDLHFYTDDRGIIQSWDYVHRE